MKKFGLATAAAGVLTAAAIGLAAPALAAPTGPSDVQQTIEELQAQGYNVIVNRLGNAPLAEATVVGVREGQTYSRTDRSGPGDDLRTTITGRTVYLDVR